MISKCIIVHGCPSTNRDDSYSKHWMPWVAKQLQAKGISVELPIMPEPWSPNYDNFEKVFNKYDVDENTVLVGHSCGCAFLVNWLGKSSTSIKKLILVAPWKVNDHEGDVGRDVFYGFNIDTNIKERVGEITMFTADDEESSGKESLEMYHRALGGEIIELSGRGHYTLTDMGTEEFPEILDKIV
ncbi:MAG: RBBP9/YdeN family alpha/beta hydrolase [Patescibacteria group bacterium]